MDYGLAIDALLARRARAAAADGNVSAETSR
jgi:hypothetical protein